MAPSGRSGATRLVQAMGHIETDRPPERSSPPVWTSCASAATRACLSRPTLGDRGVDIVAMQGPYWFAVQCKRYRGRIGPSVIQGLAGVIVLGGEYAAAQREFTSTSS